MITFRRNHTPKRTPAEAIAPYTAASNCGLPPGVVHQHVDVCYEAGFAAGYAKATEHAWGDR